MASKFSFSGRSLFYGLQTNMTIHPSKRKGIRFIRTDLENRPVIEASLKNVVPSKLPHTTLGSKGVVVHTVEHLLSALYGLELTDLDIEIDSPELPIFDGSAKHYVDQLRDADLPTKQDNLYTITKAVHIKRGDSIIIAKPAESLTVTYLLDYPNEPFLQNRLASLIIHKENYFEYIASARTFSLKEPLIQMRQAGFLKNSTGEEGVIIDEKGPDKELHHFNEHAFHKILDIIGDISLLGNYSLAMDITAIRSGHKDTIELIRLIENRLIPLSLATV